MTPYDIMYLTRFVMNLCELGFSLGILLTIITSGLIALPMGLHIAGARWFDLLDMVQDRWSVIKGRQPSLFLTSDDQERQRLLDEVDHFIENGSLREE